MERETIQVKKEHYKSSSYDDLLRWVSYYYQIDLVRKTKGKKILEVGVGNKSVTNYLKQNGFKISTLDIDKELSPDFVGDLRMMPLKKNSFETVLCCEVLEHLPFKDFEKCLRELRRVSKNNVIISLPYFSARFEVLFKIPGTYRFFGKPILSLFLRLNLPFIKKNFDGQHYWEIGYRGYSLRKIRKIIKKHFEIKEEVRPLINTYHYFFVLNPKK
jgi:ubiquinone/menaquinone biosynthesis C-methylase UbiE